MLDAKWPLVISIEQVAGGWADQVHYPFHHLMVQGDWRQLSRLLWAVEILARAGWELVSIAEIGRSGATYATLRRAAPAGPRPHPPSTPAHPSPHLPQQP